jgi:polyisoprenoid-binding protein YceI
MTILVSLIASLFLGISPMNTTTNLSTDTIEDGVYTASLEDSKVEWQAYKVTGQHNGEVNLSSGELEFKDNQIVGGNFVVDMTSIKVMDLSGESKNKLEGHLKSPDFFGVEKYPNAKFTIQNAFPVGEDGKYRIKGDMTIKEDTHPVSFDAMMTEEGDLMVAKAEFKIDRSKYNVRYGSGSFFDNLGDKTIYDEFDLNVTLKVAK